LTLIEFSWQKSILNWKMKTSESLWRMPLHISMIRSWRCITNNAAIALDQRQPCSAWYRAKLPVNLDRSEIVDTKPSKVSMMPSGLLDTLTADEVIDLLVYLQSGGNPKSERY